MLSSESINPAEDRVLPVSRLQLWLGAGGMHPCASEEGHCCGNTTYAAAAVRFTALFRAVGARVMLAYDVYPFCGDGIDLVVSHNFYDPSRRVRLLLSSR